MNKKRIWFTLPTVLIPYIVLFAVAVIFFYTEVPAFSFIIDRFFRENALDLAAAVFAYSLFAAICSTVSFCLAVRRKWDAMSLAKTAMLVKLIQMPAYIVIFLLGIIFMIMLFTIPFAIAFFMLDCLTLILTGLLTTAAVINGTRQGMVTTKVSVWIILLQFLFVADVVSTIVFYFLLRRKQKTAIREG